MNRLLALLLLSLLVATLPQGEALACKDAVPGWRVNIPTTPAVLPANGVLALYAEVVQVSWEVIDPRQLEVVVSAPDGSVVEGIIEARMLKRCGLVDPSMCIDRVLLLWRGVSELSSNAEYQFTVRTWSPRYGGPSSEATGRFTTSPAVSSAPSQPTHNGPLELSVGHKMVNQNLCTISEDPSCNGTCFGPPCTTFFTSIEERVPSIGVTPWLDGVLPANQILLRIAGQDEAAWSASSPSVRLGVELPSTTPSPWCLTLVAESLIDGSTAESEPLCVSDPGLELGQRVIPRPAYCDPLYVDPGKEGEADAFSNGDFSICDDGKQSEGTQRNEGGMCSTMIHSSTSARPLVLLWGVLAFGIVGLGRRKPR